jgi:ABC-type transport system substrate-binding protein
MSSKDTGIDRRRFLQYSTVAGLSTLMSASWPWLAMAATKERLTILSSIGLDSLHPYAHSSGPQYGIWQHMLEPLIDVDYARKEYYGVLAESWEFQGKKWVFHLKKGIRFHY